MSMNPNRLKPKFENPTDEARRKIRDVLKLIKKGWQKNEIYDYMLEHYGIRQRDAYDYYHDALCLMEQNEPLEEYALQVRDEQIARITDIYKTAMERNNFNAALKAADMLNRIGALYSDTTNLQVMDGMIKFSFDGEEAKYNHFVNPEVIKESEERHAKKEAEKKRKKDAE